MPEFFTHYWSPSENADVKGELLQHIASDTFIRRGVGVGDTVFAVCVQRGRLCVIARMTVEKITDAATAALHTKQSSGFADKKEHCVCRPEFGTPISFDRFVPFDVAMALRFNGQPLKLDPNHDDWLDRQTLRGVRRLDRGSADLLNHIIENELENSDRVDGSRDDDLGDSTGDEGNDGFDDEFFEEGSRVPIYHKRLERNRQVVRRKKQQVMKQAGRLACECCKFDFFEVYGSLGYGYAECHHRFWLSETPLDGFRLTRLADLAIVCSNCHRMLHRDITLTVERLRCLLETHD